MGLASVAEARRDCQTAQGYLEALLKPRAAAVADKNALVAEVLLAQLYQQVGDTEKAAALISEAIEANPEDFNTYLAAAGAGASGDTAYYLARVLIDRGQSSDAKPLLTVALKTKLSFLYKQDAENQLEKLSGSP